MSEAENSSELEPYLIETVVKAYATGKFELSVKSIFNDRVQIYLLHILYIQEFGPNSSRRCSIGSKKNLTRPARLQWMIL